MTGPGAWGATLVRVALGVIYVMHGWLALTVIGPSGVAGYTVRLGYPPSLSTALAWYLIVVHLVGGALLAIGLWTRIVALLQLPIMASATFLLHWSQGFFMKAIVVDASGGRAIAGGYEYDLLVLVATCALVLLGPGKLAVDGRRGSKFAIP